MKHIPNKSIGIMLTFSFLFSCTTAPETQQEAKIPIVDAGYFTVEPPYDVLPYYSVWSCQVNKELGTIRFEKGKYSVLGGSVGSTLIQVFRNGVKQDAWHLSEEQVADDFRSQEKNIIRSEWSTKSEYKLRDLKKNVTTIGEKKLYLMSYKVTYPYNLMEGWRVVNAVLYLYFSPGFKENHIFYGFLFSESHALGALVTFDVELIYPVINSLKIKTP